MLRASGRSSDSGRPPSPPSRPAGQWQFGVEASPLTAAGPSRTHTGFPHRSPLLWPLVCPSVQAPVSRWAPVVAWATLIFVLSSIPDLSTGLGAWDLVLRKIAHAAEYAVLGALLVRALHRSRLSFVIGVAYAASDEFHQTFVTGRAGTVLDVGVDAVGVALGVALAIRSRWVDFRRGAAQGGR